MSELEFSLPRSAKVKARVVFAIYLFFLAWFLFISVGGTVRDEYFDKRIVHWVPMKNTLHTLSIILSGNFGAENKVGFTYLALRNIIGNILLFVPFGFLAPIACSRVKGLKEVLLLVGGFSLLAELTQFGLKIGVFDIDDVIFNLIGGIFGFICLNRFRQYLFPGKL